MQKIVNVASVGSTGETIYGISFQQSTGYVLDWTDKTYKAAASLTLDTDACCPMAELSIGALDTQVYQLNIADDPTKPWKGDYYTFIVYKQSGVNSDPSIDEIVGVCMLVVQNDKILDKFHSYSGV